MDTPRHDSSSGREANIDLQLSVPKLVGREAELIQLQHWLDKALTGERQLVFVGGEPGIGKTALVDAFLAQLRERGEVRITYGQCVEQYGSGEAYLPLLEATNRLCREPGSERRIEALKQYAPTWLAQLPGLVERRELELLQQHVQGTSRERMLREMAEAAELFTARRGLVLVLEDLHWSDVSTLDWLAHIAHRREPAKLMIIGTYRPADVLASGHPLRRVVQELQAHGQGEELHLVPLAETAVQDYLLTRFPGMDIPPELSGALHHRTGGNPLFLTTMVDYLSAHGVIVADGDRWIIASALHALESEVPENLRLLIEKQLDRLEKQALSILEVASVVGAEFSVAAVAAGLQQPLESLEELCEHLARREQFITAQGMEEWPDGTLSSRYSFTHALYQTVLSDRIPAARRVRLHRLIAACREAAHGERAPEIATELAVHFEAGRDLVKAVYYRERAGALAARRHAHQEAVAHFRRGLTLLETQPDTPTRVQHELRLLMALGGSLIPLTGYTAPEIKETFARALTLCRGLEDRSHVFPVLWGLLGFSMARADLSKAAELAEQMFYLAQQTHDTFFELTSSFVKGQVSFHSGDLVAARPHFVRAAALYDARLHSTRVFRTVQDTGVATLSLEAAALWMLGFPDQALARVQEAVALARHLSHPMSLAWALNLQTTVHYFRREERAIRERAEEALQFALGQEMPYWIALSRLLYGWSRLDEGGLTQIHHGLGMLRQIGADVGRPSYLAFLAEAYAATGDPGRGLAILDEAIAVAETTGERVAEADLYRLKGELTLQKAGVRDWGLGVGNEEEQTTKAEAEGYFQRALDLARRQQAKSWELRAAISLARMWRQQGKNTEARQLLEDVYSWFSEGFGTRDLQEAEALLREIGSTVERAGAKREVEGPTPKASEPLPGSPFSLQPTAYSLSQSSALNPQDFRSRIPDTQHPTLDTQYMFRREAEYWTLVFDGVGCHIEHTLGLQYIAHLLQHPRQDFTAVFLATGNETPPEPVPTGSRTIDDGRGPQVTTAIRQRLTDLQEELAKAREFNDQGRVERLQEELETLTQELMQTLSSGRRRRATTSPAERARLNVTRAIRSTLKKIAVSHPSLGRYLTQTVKTGTTCVYTPDPSPPIPWQF
jgi:predicted ATPase